MLVLGLLGLSAAIALVVFIVFDQAEEKAAVRESLRTLGDYEVTNVRDRQLLASFQQRALLPMLKGITGLGRRFTPVGYVDTVRGKLITSGRPTPDDLDRFLAIRVITVVAIPAAAVLIFGLSGLEGTNALGLFVLVGLGLLLGPDAILNRKAEERQHTIRVKLPDILDLLVISVEAGLGFEQALDRTVASVPGPLSDEFARMLGEVRAGANRAEALRAMDARVNVQEVRSFILAILQADTFGVSIGRILRAQADEARIRRRQLAQEQAMKAPVKMLIPLVFCIFPALFVVILGPAGISISRNF